MKEVYFGKTQTTTNTLRMLDGGACPPPRARSVIDIRRNTPVFSKHVEDVFTSMSRRVCH